MSGMQERRAALVTGQELSPVGSSGPTDVRAADLEIRRRQGHQVMAAFAAFGAATESTRLKRWIKISHLICISFVCIVPVLLFWSVALNG